MISSGCVVPGSMIGRLGLSGSVIAPDNVLPIIVKVTLSKQYGLGGLDRYFGKSEDYGHRDQTITVQVQEGAFSTEFLPVVYHISLWLIPPVGVFPRHPPTPVYIIEFSDAFNEIYLIGIEGGKVKWKVFDKSTHSEKAKDQTTWEVLSGDYAPKGQKGEEVWYLWIKVRKR